MGHPRVQNKNVSNVQITAEQLLRDARHVESIQKLPRLQMHLHDMDELTEFLLRRRQAFEQRIRRQDANPTRTWTEYARWEERLGDLRRATSIWERAVSLHYREPSLWMKYVKMNMRNRLLNSARNVWERALSALPRHDQLWYGYIHMENMLGNTSHVRSLFNRWTSLWAPNHLAWFSFIKFELKCKEVERAREIFESLVQSRSSCAEAWIKYAKFEVKYGKSVERARRAYERANEQLLLQEDEAGIGKLLLAFARFEEMCKEIERARCILKFAIGSTVCNDEDKEALQKELLGLERRYESAESIETAIGDKKRVLYERIVADMPQNYDAWLDLAKLEADCGDKDTATRINRVREVYKRAIAITPPSSQKRHWQRYIYVWINYALFEELEAKDLMKAQEVYAACLNSIPHHSFSFSKIWILASEVELRRKNLKGARRILGNALGRAPRDKLFKRYIEMEMTLGNIDRCRILYGKYVEWAPSSSSAWIQFAEMERSLGENGRARSIFELAAMQPVLDKSEALLKAYTNLEFADQEGQILENQLDDAENRGGSKGRCMPLNKSHLNVTQRLFDDVGDVSLVHEPCLKRKRHHMMTGDFYAVEMDHSKFLQAAYKWKRSRETAEVCERLIEC